MIDNPESVNPDNKAAEPEPLDELQLWASWLQQAAVIGADIVQLLQLELRLAISDSRRLLILALLFVPLLMLAWISFCGLLAWLVFQLNASVTQGLLAFLVIQLAGLACICSAWKHYRKSLSLPLTRQQLQAFVGGQRRDT